jgi:hypothetical protein
MNYILNKYVYLSRHVGLWIQVGGSLRLLLSSLRDVGNFRLRSENSYWLLNMQVNVRNVLISSLQNHATREKSIVDVKCVLHFSQ